MIKKLRENNIWSIFTMESEFDLFLSEDRTLNVIESKSQLCSKREIYIAKQRIAWISIS